MGERVTKLESDVPHIGSALNQIQSDIRKAIWIFIALFAAVLVKFTVDGGFTNGVTRAEAAPPPAAIERQFIK